MAINYGENAFLHKYSATIHFYENVNYLRAFRFSLALQLLTDEKGSPAETLALYSRFLTSSIKSYDTNSRLVLIQEAEKIHLIQVLPVQNEID